MEKVCLLPHKWLIFTLKLTKFTVFHHFKHKRGLVHIEYNHFIQFMEVISTIIKKFPRPKVPWVPHLSMSIQIYQKQDMKVDLRLPILAKYQLLKNLNIYNGKSWYYAPGIQYMSIVENNDIIVKFLYLIFTSLLPKFIGLCYLANS